MPFILMLAAGAAFSLYLFLNHYPLYGAIVIIVTLAVFFAAAAAKKRRVMSDPLKREALEKKKRSMERRFGVDAYNLRLDQGTMAEAAIVSITDTRDRVDDNPRLVFHLEVRPEYGTPFPLQVEKTVPFILLPQFQPGKVFTINYDPQDPGIMGFISYRTAEGTIVELKDYNI